MNKHRVYISGSGIIMGKQKSRGDGPVIHEADYRHIIDDMQTALGDLNLRYVDKVSSLSMAAAWLALQDRGADIAGGFTDDAGLILGTEYGPLSSIHSFDMTSIEQGALFVNPGLFPNTVLNAPACQLGIRLSVAGPVYTICNGLTSGLDAIGMGYYYVRHGILPKVIAGAVDETGGIQSMIHKKTLPVGEACGFVILEGLPPRGKNGLENCVEIKGYQSENIDSQGNISSRLAELILRTLDMSGDLDDVLDLISVSARLPGKEGEILLGNICDLIGYHGTRRRLDIDWMGAGGLVQVNSILNGNRKNDRREYVFINLDDRRASVLALHR